MSDDSKKTAVLTVRLPPAVKGALQKVATAERRSLANMLEITILDYCERHSAAAAKANPRNRPK
jgi:predicted transcriptional regulator